MNTKEIELFVDKLSNDKKTSSKKEKTQKKRRWHSRKLLGMPVGMLIMTIGAVLVGAVLISGFTWFGAIVETDITTSGVEGSMFYIDDVLVTTQTGFDLGDDVTGVMLAGDNSSFVHKFYSDPQDGNWSITIDTSDMSYFMDNPEHKYYGFYFFTDQDNNEFTVMAGETKNVTFYYVLDPEFQQLEVGDSIPFSIDVDAVKI